MKHWKKQALGDVLEYTQPSHFIVKNTEYDPEFQIPVLTPGKSFILGYTNEQEGIYDRLPTIIFDDFTTAFKYVDFPFKVKSSAMKMLNTTCVNFDIKFIYYLMQTINFEAKEHKRYWISKYSQLQVRIPPLEEQKKIAAILDAADAYRQKTKALIDKYDQLTQSLFLDMFGDPVTNPKGWKKAPLSTICDFSKTTIKPEEIKEGDAYLGLESIQKSTGKIIEKFSVAAGELKSNKFFFDENYILYGKLRPYLNKVAVPDFSGVCSTDIIPLKPIADHSVKAFIVSLLRGDWFVSYADERSSGANLPRISPKEVQKYSSIIPPLEFQNQFAERVAQIEKQKQQAEASLVKAEELFSSLLQRAFKGELTS